MKDVAVLGAGMVGIGTALALQERGFNVVLLDRSPPGTETSYGNAGVIQAEACEPYAMPRGLKSLYNIALRNENGVDWNLAGLLGSTRALFSYWRNSAPSRHRVIGGKYAKLISRATRDHEKWIEASNSEAIICREGYRIAFRDEDSFEKQFRDAERLRDLYGISFDVEDSTALGAAEPALRHQLLGAIRWRDAWTCSDPGALAQAYSDCFVGRGGELLQFTARQLSQTATGWKVESANGAIEAEELVIAMGPWSPMLLAPLSYKITMIRKKGYHAEFEYPVAVGGPRLKLPLLDAAIGAVYAPMRAGLRITTGADLSMGPRKCKPRQLQRAEAAARELLEIGAPIAPSFWSGIRPCMPDMMPVVGAAPRHRGLWFNFGHGHQGFTLGPTTGHLLADAMSTSPSRRSS